MLTVTRLTDAEYLISSVALSIDEYYAGVGESPGVWAGQWSEGLGLACYERLRRCRASGNVADGMLATGRRRVQYRGWLGGRLERNPIGERREGLKLTEKSEDDAFDTWVYRVSFPC